MTAEVFLPITAEAPYHPIVTATTTGGILYLQGEPTMNNVTEDKPGLSRRGALKLGAAAATLPLVHIRTAGAAGKVSIGFWDHWVPDGNKIMQQQVDTWAAQSKVDVHVDFITSVGNKLLLTAAAEAQAKTGHDVIALYMWDVVQPRRRPGQP